MSILITYQLFEETDVWFEFYVKYVLNLPDIF